MYEKKITSITNDVPVIGLIHSGFDSVHCASMRQEKGFSDDSRTLALYVYASQSTHD